VDALTLFMLRYGAVHERFVSELFAGLTDAQLRQRPHGVNSVLWLVWHVARVQDVAVTRFVADEALPDLARERPCSRSPCWPPLAPGPMIPGPWPGPSRPRSAVGSVPEAAAAPPGPVPSRL
jgi:hypothetical protein